ncbi:hypothetical protein GLP21_06055 [Photobacterium carnosum]|uniref:hypothetical protein n=1 Tax=Photobacterium carnosum TaxID=2023717 RepID=UPI001E336521|nr:hypothetical protein [Photobacterium carnosum]MCD9548210.1 hypothetical protein [Photobacterium carnosum]MCF2305716.1 hypothetical protein [Photobacterium carnosum]
MANEIFNFKDTLMVKNSGDGETYFSLASDTLKRQLAVVSVLELIKSDLSASYSTGGTSSKSSYALEQHMKNLSEYTDCILNAMNGASKN